jgi:hypothetical protein
MARKRSAEGTMSDAVTRTKSGQFAKGWSGGPGRPARQRNRLTETVTTFLSEDFELHGRDVIEAVRTKHPQIYLSACVSLLPKQQTVEKISPLGHLTDEELDQLERFLTASRAQQVSEIDGKS